ncbi:MAG: ATP-binding protein [Pseudomonadota bacterium]
MKGIAAVAAVGLVALIVAALGGGVGDAGEMPLAVIAFSPAMRAALGRVGFGAMPDSLRKTDAPAAVTRLSGQIVAMNAAMEAEAADAATIDEAVSAVAELEPGIVYRLSRSAMRTGLAIEKTRCLVDQGPCFLSVTQLDNSHLSWRVLPQHMASQLALPSEGTPHDKAAYAHLGLDALGEVRMNPRCRDLFGGDVGKLIENLKTANGELVAGECRLACRDGAERDFFAVPIGVREVGVLLPRGAEIFLFELDGIVGGRRAQQTRGSDDLPVAVMYLARDGRLEWLNAAAVRTLGGKAMPGRMLAEYLTCRGERLEALVERATLGTTVGTVFATGALSDRALQLSLNPAKRLGGGRLAAVLTDATELHALQDKYTQSQKMEAVGQLAGGVAHDFNNLITAINGHCDLLLLGKDATQPEYSDLMQIRQNANRAAALVRQLLAFSRKQTLKPEALSLSDVISDTLYLLDRLMGARVKLRLDPDPSGPVGQVRADQRQLEQALINLVVNARDAMPKGGTVTISTRRRLFRVDEQRSGGLIPAGDYVEMVVTDEGAGLDDATIGKVFDPFFTTKAQGEGTGLGLSTVYGIVKQSGGMIFAENRPEGGALFRMLLPRIEPEIAAEVKPERAAAPPAVDLTGAGRVLLVEDEAAVRSFAARALRLRGYDVTMAEEAEEALSILEDGDTAFDLIVSDVMMPGMDGPTFVGRAREMMPDVRVLFVSGYAEEAFRKQIERPDYAFLAKPFSLSELTAKIKEVLQQTD